LLFALTFNAIFAKIPVHGTSSFHLVFGHMTLSQLYC
jgi:hypothetical protein